MDLPVNCVGLSSVNKRCPRTTSWKNTEVIRYEQNQNMNHQEKKKQKKDINQNLVLS